MKKTITGATPSSLSTLMWAKNKAKAWCRRLGEEGSGSRRLKGPFGEAVKIAANRSNGLLEARVETPGLGFWFIGIQRQAANTYVALTFLDLPFVQKKLAFPGSIFKSGILADMPDIEGYCYWMVITGGQLRLAFYTGRTFGQFSQAVDGSQNLSIKSGVILGKKNLLAVLFYPKAWYLIHDQDSEWRLYAFDYQQKGLSQTPITLADPPWDEYLRASVFQGNGGYFYVAIERSRPPGLTLIDIERRHVDRPNVTLLRYPRIQAPDELPEDSPAVAMSWQWIKLVPAVWRAMQALESSATVQLEGVDSGFSIAVTTEEVPPPDPPPDPPDPHVRTRNHGTLSFQDQLLEVVISLVDGAVTGDVYAATLEGEDIKLRLQRMIQASANGQVITGIYQRDDLTTMTWMKAYDPALNWVRPYSDFNLTRWSGTSLSGSTQAIEKLDYTLTGHRMLQDERLRFISEYGDWLLLSRSVKTWSGSRDDASFVYDFRIYHKTGGQLVYRKADSGYAELHFASPRKAYVMDSPDIWFDYDNEGRAQAWFHYAVDLYGVSGEAYPLFTKLRRLTDVDNVTGVSRIGTTGSLSSDLSIHWLGFVANIH